MVGGFDGESGHAFAEFFVPEDEKNSKFLKNKDYRFDSDGKWISLDWFTGKSHKKYINDIEVYEDI